MLSIFLLYPVGNSPRQSRGLHPRFPSERCASDCRMRSRRGTSLPEGLQRALARTRPVARTSRSAKPLEFHEFRGRRRGRGTQIDELSIAASSGRGVKPPVGAARALPEACQMTLWFVFALMTVAAIFAVPPGSLVAAQRCGRAGRMGSEVAVYKDQLAEIERDLAAGLIASAGSRGRTRRDAAAGCSPRPAERARHRQPKSSLQWRRAAADAGACRPAARGDRRLHAARFAELPGLSAGRSAGAGPRSGMALARYADRAGRRRIWRRRSRTMGKRLERDRAGYVGVRLESGSRTP